MKCRLVSPFAFLLVSLQIIGFLSTGLVSDSLAASEYGRVVRSQLIDFQGAGYTTFGMSIGSDENMDYLYVLKRNANADTHDVVIFKRVIFYGVTGYTPEQDRGPLNCSFQEGSGIYGNITASPDGRWLAIPDQNGFSFVSPFYEPSWDAMTNHGYIVDLDAPNRECAPAQLYNLFAGYGVDAFFTADSRQLIFGVPYAKNPPTDSPGWGSTAGRVIKYAQDEGGNWDPTGEIRLFVEGGLNQNAGVGKSVVASYDGSVIAILAPADRVKRSEVSWEEAGQFGYIPENLRRTPDNPLITITTGDEYHYEPLSVDRPELYHNSLRTDPYLTGRRLATSSEGRMVVTTFRDWTMAINSFYSREQNTKIQTLISQGDGTWLSQVQVVDFTKCIDPVMDDREVYHSTTPYDLSVSSDGTRLAILLMDNIWRSGVCLLSRDNNVWKPITDASRALSDVLTSNGLNAIFSTAELTANKKLTRLLVHHGNAATQIDIDWWSDNNGLPIWLLREASKQNQ